MSGSRVRLGALGQRSLHQQIKLARFWLPVAIVAVVVVHQVVIVPLGGVLWQFWVQILFYSILGPIATFATLNWIASEVRLRERAQEELTRLYTELQDSHGLLGAIQEVTGAGDLDAALKAASRGIVKVTEAVGAAVVIGSRGPPLSESYGLNAALAEDAGDRDRRLRAGEVPPEEGGPGGCFHVLSEPIAWAEETQGSVHGYFAGPPDARQRESFRILCAEFTSTAEAVRGRTRDLLTLFEVDRSVRAEGNLTRLLQTLLTQMIARAGAEAGGVYLADDENLLELHAHHGLAESPSNVAVRGLVRRVASETSPHLVTHLSEEERAVGGPILAGARSALLLPLLGDEGLLGVVVLSHSEPGRFDEDGLPFLNLLASQVTLAVRNARAYLQSEELAIIEERARIAREIHDSVAQSLAFSALKLDLVARLLERDPTKALVELDSTKVAIRELIREVRRSIFALRPVDLERHGFVETLRSYCSDYSQQNDIGVELDIEPLPNLTMTSEAVLFRIFQEAMNNVAKHAEASRVAVRAGRTDDRHAFVEVEDDGRGFDQDEVDGRVTSAGGLGLKQMRERVEGRGGTLRIRTAPGQGTRLRASLPE